MSLLIITSFVWAFSFGLTKSRLSGLDPGLIAWNAWRGFLLVQISNLAFAAGQVLYKRLRPSLAEVRDHELFALLYFGASLVSGIPVLFFGNWMKFRNSLNPADIWVLVCLGVIASGICFFAWNKGATRTGPGTLAVMNNLKIPLGILVSIVVFGENVNWARLLAGKRRDHAPHSNESGQR